MADHPDLPTGLPEWIAATGGGTITTIERGLSRREAWIIDVTRPDGTVGEYFLRLARADDPANTSYLLHREARIIQALADAGLRVPAIHGIDTEREAVLYERVPGRSDLQHMGADQQNAVYRHYLELLAELHAIDIETLPLEGVDRPVTAEDCSLRELDVVLSHYDIPTEPLATFGVKWLREHVPHEVDRVALVHGDAGTPNFLFEGDRVNGLIDWEWFHLGDPMEDLGNAVVHATFHPSGDWPELLPTYEKASGAPVDIEKVRYYTVHLLVRSVIALHSHIATWDPHVPVALNLCYTLANDRLMCDAIADAIGVERQRPDLPEVPDAGVTLYDVVAENLRGDVLPATTGNFPRNRVETSVLLVQALEREHRIGPAVTEIELTELGELLGERPPDLGTGLARLDAAIGVWGPEREADVVRYLGRRAWRAEQLWEPVVSLFPGLELRPIE